MPRLPRHARRLFAALLATPLAAPLAGGLASGSAHTAWAGSTPPAPIAAIARADAPVSPDSILVHPATGGGGRTPITNTTVDALLARDQWVTPQAGQPLPHVRRGDAPSDPPADARPVWQTAEPNDDGSFALPRGGWGWWSHTSDRERVMILDVRGSRVVYVNGQPRPGDVYNLGIVRLPVLIREGENGFLFASGRGGLRASLHEPPAPVFLENRDATVPDLIIGETRPQPLGVFITNATNATQSGMIVRAKVGDRSLFNRVPVLPPRVARRLSIAVPAPDEALGPDDGPVDVTLTLMREDQALGEVTFSLRIRRANQPHVRTFISDIDASTQYYGVVPASDAGENGRVEGLSAAALTLHGAGVQGRRQAFSYQAKPGVTVVAPTNRRPFGFDWEDWGRLDALEVLEHATRRYRLDPDRTWLTGHSMGGHGTWSIGAHLAPMFAALGPSAGWRDFWSYGGAATFETDTPLGALMHRAQNASRTLLLEDNYQPLGVYVLHGDADRTVPVSQARFMRERLAESHTNFAYYERAGAGHWWGNQCMDWPPMFEYFAHNTRTPASEQRTVSFTTVDPGISSTSAWLAIERQLVSREPSRVDAVISDNGVRVTTSNTSVVRFDADLMPQPEDGQPWHTYSIDGVELTIDRGAHQRFERDADGAWSHAPLGRRGTTQKSDTRSGPFKNGFRNRMVFVYGTAGTDAENEWAFAKARYDAEVFSYRGNGSVEVMPDTRFNPPAMPDRSVVLYGNRTTNTAWRQLLPEPPIDVVRGGARVGDRTLTRDDLGVIFVQPRRGSATATVTAVSGTGLTGMRLTTRLPYFVSGVHYPDWMVFGDAELDQRLGDVIGAGFFDTDWRVGDDTAWRGDASP